VVTVADSTSLRHQLTKPLIESTAVTSRSPVVEKRSAQQDLALLSSVVETPDKPCEADITNSSTSLKDTVDRSTLNSITMDPAASQAADLNEDTSTTNVSDEPIPDRLKSVPLDTTTNAAATSIGQIVVTISQASVSEGAPITTPINLNSVNRAIISNEQNVSLNTSVSVSQPSIACQPSAVGEATSFSSTSTPSTVSASASVDSRVSRPNITCQPSTVSQADTSISTTSINTTSISTTFVSSRSTPTTVTPSVVSTSASVDIRVTDPIHASPLITIKEEVEDLAYNKALNLPRTPRVRTNVVARVGSKILEQGATHSSSQNTTQCKDTVQNTSTALNIVSEGLAITTVTSSTSTSKVIISTPVSKAHVNSPVIVTSSVGSAVPLISQQSSTSVSKSGVYSTSKPLSTITGVTLTGGAFSSTKTTANSASVPIVKVTTGKVVPLMSVSPRVSIQSNLNLLSKLYAQTSSGATTLTSVAVTKSTAVLNDKSVLTSAIVTDKNKMKVTAATKVIGGTTCTTSASSVHTTITRTSVSVITATSGTNPLAASVNRSVVPQSVATPTTMGTTPVSLSSVPVSISTVTTAHANSLRPAGTAVVTTTKSVTVSGPSIAPLFTAFTEIKEEIVDPDYDAAMTQTKKVDSVTQRDALAEAKNINDEVQSKAPSPSKVETQRQNQTILGGKSQHASVPNSSSISQNKNLQSTVANRSQSSSQTPESNISRTRNPLDPASMRKQLLASNSDKTNDACLINIVEKTIYKKCVNIESAGNAKSNKSCTEKDTNEDVFSYAAPPSRAKLVTAPARNTPGNRSTDVSPAKKLTGLVIPATYVGEKQSNTLSAERQTGVLPPKWPTGVASTEDQTAHFLRSLAMKKAEEKLTDVLKPADKLTHGMSGGVKKIEATVNLVEVITPKKVAEVDSGKKDIVAHNNSDAVSVKEWPSDIHFHESVTEMSSVPEEVFAMDEIAEIQSPPVWNPSLEISFHSAMVKKSIPLTIELERVYNPSSPTGSDEIISSKSKGLSDTETDGAFAQDTCAQGINLNTSDISPELALEKEAVTVIEVSNDAKILDKIVGESDLDGNKNRLGIKRIRAKPVFSTIDRLPLTTTGKNISTQSYMSHESNNLVTAIDSTGVSRAMQIITDSVRIAALTQSVTMLPSAVSSMQNVIRPLLTLGVSESSTRRPTTSAIITSTASVTPTTSAINPTLAKPPTNYAVNQSLVVPATSLTVIANKPLVTSVITQGVAKLPSLAAVTRSMTTPQTTPTGMQMVARPLTTAVIAQSVASPPSTTSVFNSVANTLNKSPILNSNLAKVPTTSVVTKSLASPSTALAVTNTVAKPPTTSAANQSLSKPPRTSAATQIASKSLTTSILTHRAVAKPPTTAPPASQSLTKLPNTSASPHILAKPPTTPATAQVYNKPQSTTLVIQSIKPSTTGAAVSPQIIAKPVTTIVVTDVIAQSTTTAAVAPSISPALAQNFTKSVSVTVDTQNSSQPCSLAATQSLTSLTTTAASILDKPALVEITQSVMRSLTTLGFSGSLAKSGTVTAIAPDVANSTNIGSVKSSVSEPAIAVGAPSSVLNPSSTKVNISSPVKCAISIGTNQATSTKVKVGVAKPSGDKLVTLNTNKPVVTEKKPAITVEPGYTLKSLTVGHDIHRDLLSSSGSIATIHKLSVFQTSTPVRGKVLGLGLLSTMATSTPIMTPSCEVTLSSTPSTSVVVPHSVNPPTCHANIDVSTAYVGTTQSRTTPFASLVGTHPKDINDHSNARESDDEEFFQLLPNADQQSNSIDSSNHRLKEDFIARRRYIEARRQRGSAECPTVDDKSGNVVKPTDVEVRSTRKRRADFEDAVDSTGDRLRFVGHSPEKKQQRSERYEFSPIAPKRTRADSPHLFFKDDALNSSRYLYEQSDNDDVNTWLTINENCSVNPATPRLPKSSQWNGTGHRTAGYDKFKRRKSLNRLSVNAKHFLIGSSNHLDDIADFESRGFSAVAANVLFDGLDEVLNANRESVHLERLSLETQLDSCRFDSPAVKRLSMQVFILV